MAIVSPLRGRLPAFDGDKRKSSRLRNMQTRAFNTTDRVKTLAVVVATLQNSEFLINKANASLGVVTATTTKNLKHLRMNVTIHSRGNNQTLVQASSKFNLQAVDELGFYQPFFAALERSMCFTAYDVN